MEIKGVNNILHLKRSFIKKHYYKVIIILSTINIYLGLINVQKYFDNNDNNIDIDLSPFRRSDYMNVALSARPYELISDYFSSKNNLDNGYSIIKDDHIIFSQKKYHSYLWYKKSIKIGYIDINKERGIHYVNYLTKILGDKYNFIIELDNPDYLIFSFHGCNHNNIKFKNSIKIAIYEESFFPSFIEEDYVLGVNHILLLDRYFRITPLLEYINDLNIKNKSLRDIRQKVIKESKRRKFCGIIINNQTKINNFTQLFIEKISEYKNVERYTQVNNNIDSDVFNKINFLKKFKFSIIFEKSSNDGYATAPILYAFLAGTIPIYYGDFFIDEFINEKTYILVRSNIDLNDKIEYIKKIDKSDILYKEFFLEDVLIDDNAYKKRKKDEKDFWNHIFLQDKYDAKRIDSNYMTRPCKIKE